MSSVCYGLVCQELERGDAAVRSFVIEVSKATLGYWLLKLGINVRRVALAPGETLEVKRAS